MGIRDIKQTHTYVELELSKAAYDEISRKLRDAGYEHAFMGDGTIDMHGLAVTPWRSTKILRAEKAAGRGR